MRLKNLFITIGSIGGVVSTIPFVVSCNGSNHEGASTTDNNDDDWTPKKYSYSFNIDFHPLFQDLQNPKGGYDMNVHFKSDTLYSQQEIKDSIYMMDEVDNTSPKSYFEKQNDEALPISDKYIGSDIKEINKMTLGYGRVISLNIRLRDLYVLSIQNWVYNEN